MRPGSPVLTPVCKLSPPLSCPTVCPPHLPSPAILVSLSLTLSLVSSRGDLAASTCLSQPGSLTRCSTSAQTWPSARSPSTRSGPRSWTSLSPSWRRASASWWHAATAPCPLRPSLVSELGALGRSTGAAVCPSPIRYCPYQRCDSGKVASLLSLSFLICDMEEAISLTGSILTVKLRSFGSLAQPPQGPVPRFVFTMLYFFFFFLKRTLQIV